LDGSPLIRLGSIYHSRQSDHRLSYFVDFDAFRVIAGMSSVAEVSAFQVDRSRPGTVLYRLEALGLGGMPVILSGRGAC
jgi:hypothetical protein